MEVCDHLK